MSYLNNYLELVQLVNNNYKHISQFEQLERLIENVKPSVWLNQEEIDKLEIIAKTTHNANYDYRLFTSKEYQNPNNQVDAILLAKPFQLNGDMAEQFNESQIEDESAMFDLDGNER